MALNKKVLQLVLQEPVIETYGNFKVVREDLVPGGSKMRFLPYIVDPKAELVYGGPFCGGAALALSELGKRTGQKITLFYAAREKLHPRQHQARANGATLKFVRPGYMTVVQARGFCTWVLTCLLPRTRSWSLCSRSVTSWVVNRPRCGARLVPAF